MKTRISLALFLVSLSATSAFAQDITAMQNRYPGESAVVLDRLVHYRMQIKNNEPYVESKESEKLLYLNAGNASLGRYSFRHSMFHELREYTAYTQTSANRKIRVTDFKTSNTSAGSVFYDDTKETRFDFPSVATGSTGNLELSVVHTKPYLLSPFYFSRYIPVIKTELRVSFPKEISVRYVLKGTDTSMISVRQEKKKNETTLIFSAANIAPERHYPDAPDGAWYVPHVVFHIDKYMDDQGVWHNYLSDVDDLYRLNSSFVKDVNKTAGNELKALVDSLTSNINNASEKTRIVYQWVQDHIKYIAFEDGMGGFIPRDPNIVLHRRYGDCKDMSALLTLMLKTAGLPAYYTWIGTRSLPYRYSETPLPIVDNHMICAVDNGNGFTFLDGTDPYCVFGSVPAGIQDKEAMIAIDNGRYRIIRLPVSSQSENLSVDSTFIQFTDKGVAGTIDLRLRGYFASMMHAQVRNTFEKEKEKQFKSTFSRGSNKFNLVNYSVGSLEDKNSLALSAAFTLDGYGRKLDDDWYINMHLLRPYENEEIDIPRRTSPVANRFLCDQKLVTALRVPDGYTVSYLPKNKNYRNDTWGFDLSYRVEGDMLISVLSFTNDHLMLQPEQFTNWNKVLEELSPVYKETVILSKKR